MRISDWSSDVCSSDLWVVASGFRAQPGGFCLLPGADGSLEEVLLAIDPEEPLWSFAGLPAALPPGVCRIDQGLRPGAASRAALGWCLGSYAFRSEEHTSELQSLMRISYAVFCLKKKKHSYLYLPFSFFFIL